MNALSACCACGGGDKHDSYNVNGDPKEQLDKRFVRLNNGKTQDFLSAKDDKEEVEPSKDVYPREEDEWELNNQAEGVSLRHAKSNKYLVYEEVTNRYILAEEEEFFELEYDKNKGTSKIKKGNEFLAQEETGRFTSTE